MKCEFATEEVNLIKWALDRLSEEAKAVESEGFDIGNVRERIYKVLRKIGEAQRSR